MSETREARLEQRRKRREGWIRAYLDGSEPPTEPERPAARCVWRRVDDTSMLAPDCDPDPHSPVSHLDDVRAWRFCPFCGQPLVVES